MVLRRFRSNSTYSRSTTLITHPRSTQYINCVQLRAHLRLKEFSPVKTPSYRDLSLFLQIHTHLIHRVLG